LLHGSSGHYVEWATFGLERALEAAARDGLEPAIVVLPQGGRGYWINQPGGTNWADVVAGDLVSSIDATYRTLAHRSSRAIGGLSMGGHGALQLAMTRPRTFGIAGAHSPSLHGRDTAPAFFGNESDFAERDPLVLAEKVRAEERAVLWIDCGQGDEWRSRTESLHRRLDERGWRHEWRQYAGSHGAEYWTAHLPEYLAFYLRALRGAQ
jgi:S-formylglutathione hydrolase FrmB